MKKAFVEYTYYTIFSEGEHFFEYHKNTVMIPNFKTVKYYRPDRKVAYGIDARIAAFFNSYEKGKHYRGKKTSYIAYNGGHGDYQFLVGSTDKLGNSMRSSIFDMEGYAVILPIKASTIHQIPVVDGKVDNLSTAVEEIENMLSRIASRKKMSVAA